MKDHTLSHRPPPKISLSHDHDWTRGNDDLGSTVEHRPVGKLVQQSCGEVQHETFSQPTQPKPKPICDRSGKPENTEDVFVDKGNTSRSHEIDEKGLHEELGSSDRSVKPDKLSENIRVKRAHDGTGQLVEQNCSSAHTVKEQGGSHASSSHEASLEPIAKRREDLVKHNVHTHFLKDRNCEICKRTKITRAPCRRRKGEAVPRADNFGDLITADHKVLSDKF